MFNNRILELHCKGKQILDLTKIHNARIEESMPNDCNVLTDYSVLPITDKKDCYFCVEIAKYENQYFIGYDFGYNTGGGSSAPNLYHRNQFNVDLSQAIAALLNQFIVYHNYDRYIKDMKTALNVLNHKEPIQLTFNFFD